MEASQIYLLISVIVLLIIAIVVVFMRKDKKGKKLTPLASLSLILVFGGVIFGDNRLGDYPISAPIRIL